MRWTELDVGGRLGKRKRSERRSEGKRKSEKEKGRLRGLCFFFFFFFFRVSLLVEALGVGSRAQQSGGPIRAGPRGHPGPPFPSPTLYAPPDPPSSPPPITFSYFSLRTPSATPPPSQRGISHNAVFLLLLLLLLFLLLLFLSPRPSPFALNVRCSFFSFSLNDRRYDAVRSSSSSFPSARTYRGAIAAKVVLTVLFGVSSAS